MVHAVGPETENGTFVKPGRRSGARVQNSQQVNYTSPTLIATWAKIPRPENIIEIDYIFEHS